MLYEDYVEIGSHCFLEDANLHTKGIWNLLSKSLEDVRASKKTASNRLHLAIRLHVSTYLMLLCVLFLVSLWKRFLLRLSRSICFTTMPTLRIRWDLFLYNQRMIIDSYLIFVISVYFMTSFSTMRQTFTLYEWRLHCICQSVFNDRCNRELQFTKLCR